MSDYNRTSYHFGDSLEDLARTTSADHAFSQLIAFKNNPARFIEFLRSLNGEQLHHVSEKFGDERFDRIYDALTDAQKKELSRYERAQLHEQKKELAKVDESKIELEQTVASLITELHTDSTTGLKNKRSLDHYITGRINTFMDEVVEFLKEKQIPAGTQKHSLITEDTPLTTVLKNCKKDFAAYQPKGEFARDVMLGFGDLNGFKRINDTYGHTAGDKVLRIVADTLSMVSKKAMNAYDTTINLYRFGGDEFIILSEGDDDESLKQYLKREAREELDNPENYIDIDTDIRDNARVGISVGYTDALSFEGLCETMKEYIENNHNLIRVKDLSERREEITDGLLKKITDPLYKKAEHEADKDKDAFYKDIKRRYDHDPSSLTETELGMINDSRYADRFK